MNRTDELIFKLKSTPNDIKVYERDELLLLLIDFYHKNMKYPREKNE